MEPVGNGNEFCGTLYIYEFKGDVTGRIRGCLTGRSSPYATSTGNPESPSNPSGEEGSAYTSRGTPPTSRGSTSPGEAKAIEERLKGKLELVDAYCEEFWSTYLFS